MICERCGHEISDQGHTKPCVGWITRYGKPAAPKIKAKYAHGNLIFDLEADSIAGIFEQVEEIQRQAKDRCGVICDLCACLL